MRLKHQVRDNSSHLELSEELLDVTEATFCDVKVLLKCPTFEDRLRCILEEFCERKKLCYLLNFSMLETNIAEQYVQQLLLFR